MIYLIDFNTCYKIGRTLDLKKRVNQFKTSREDIKCLDLIIKPKYSIDPVSDDKEIEMELHLRCKDFNITGELFQKCDEVLQLFQIYKEEVGDLNDYKEELEKLLVPKNKRNQPNKDSEVKKKRGKTTFQYDLDGKLISEYASRAEAEQQNNLYPGRIKEAISGRHLTAGGFIWSNKALTEEELKAILLKISKSKLSKLSKHTALNQYTKNGEFIKTWDTMSEASRELGVPVSSISLCCKGNYKTAGGFVWKIG